MFWFLVLAVSASAVTATKRPNILFIVADDLGWNDVGWRNPDMITPNLNKMAMNGIILNSSYVQPVCSPSRSAFMSGLFPYHTGLQRLVIGVEQPNGLWTNLTILPQILKKQGYKTHMIGKWHLGFCKWDYTPTYRGFDSFFGYYSGSEDYYKHIKMKYLDFRDNEKPVTDQNGTYSAHIFAWQARNIIMKHNVSEPMFMYLPFQSCHEPLQVPKVYEEKYMHIHNKSRRIYSGMVTAMDDAVGAVMRTLEEKGMIDDTLVIFTTDNGGPVYAGSNNMPLRGGKITLWEGGTRGTSFVYGKILKNKKFTYNGMTHAVDWFPTIIEAAGGELPPYVIDGISMWNVIQNNLPSPRTKFVYNMNRKGEKKPWAAIRVGDWKLMVGNPGNYNDWYPVPNFDDTPPPAEKDLDGDGDPVKYRLFNIKDDPTEHHDLAAKYQDKLKEMMAEYEKMAESEIKARYPPYDPKSNPKLWGGVWSPGWC